MAVKPWIGALVKPTNRNFFLTQLLPFKINNLPKTYNFSLLTVSLFKTPDKTCFGATTKTKSFTLQPRWEL